MDKIVENKQTVWMETGTCDLGAFRELVETTTSQTSVPMAEQVVSNIPIYDGPAIRGMLGERDATNALMAEFNHVFKDGAGIVAIRKGFEDGDLVDRVTEVLDRIITEEETSLAGSGDHFAPAGANSRVWNAHEKLCMADPELYARYNTNHIFPLVSRAWLGPLYQITTQVNVVRPGGKAQTCHRDYHMGFQTTDALTQYPAHVHVLSAALTLQGAVAHCDMPIESGPTKLLPFSQRYVPGYFAYHREDFRDYFEEHCVQLPLEKGDMMFFNPATFHAAGENRTTDIHRFANLMQIGSGYGRSIEIVDRGRMCRALYAPLAKLKQSGAFKEWELENIIAATAEGYPFPANLDIDSPLSGMAPPSQQDVLRQALEEDWPEARFIEELEAQLGRKRSH